MAGERIATITETRRKVKLVYVPRVVRPFFHGLLPEGEARLMIAHEFEVDGHRRCRSSRGARP